MDKILSQDEIDALLKGMDEGKIETQPETPDPDSYGAVPYDFAHQERAIKGRMPTLDTVNDQFVRLLRNSLLSTLRRIIDVSSKGIQLVKFGDFTKTVPVPTSLHVFKMDPLRGHALLVLESRVVFTLLDIFFGGSGKTNYKIEGRDFTAIESRFILKLVNLVLGDYEKAWESVYPLKINHVRSEVNPEFVTIVPPSEMIMVIPFEMDFEEGSGKMTICIPYAVIKSIKATLYTRFQGETHVVDREWMDRFLDRIKGAKVEITVELGKRQITFRDLLNLKIGDTIMLDKGVSEPLLTKVQGVPKFLGKAGVYGSNRAVQIEAKYKTP